MTHSARGAAATKEALALRPHTQRGTHRGLRRGEVRAVAALEALDGAGPGFSVKATKMETEAKSFDAALWEELSPRVRLRF